MRFLFLSGAAFVFAGCGDSGVTVSNDAAPPDGGLPPADAGPARELSFESLTPPRGGAFFAVAASPSAVLVRAHGRYLRSDDGGETWRSQSGPAGCGGTPWLLSAGDDFFASCGDVYASGDDGETWSVVEGVGGFDPTEPATDGTSVYWVVEPGTVVRWNAATRAAEAVPETSALAFPGHVSTLGALGTDGPFVYGASSRGSAWIDASARAPAWEMTNLPGYANLHFAFGGGEGYAITPTIVMRRLPDHTFEDVGAEIETGALDALLHDGRLIVSSGLGVLASGDGGVTWSTELPVRFDGSSGLAARGDDLYAASREGLWARRGTDAWREIELHSHPVHQVFPVGEALIALDLSGGGARRRERVGADWEPLALTDHYHLTVVGDVLFSLQGQTIYRSTDAGLSFEALTDLPGTSWYITELDGALAALFEDVVYASTDGGATFTELGTVPASAYHAKTLLEVGDTVLYWDGPELYRSSDGMQTWEHLAPPPILATHVVVDDAIFAHDYFGALFRSTDLGASWTEVPQPAGVTRVAALESDGSVVYAAMHHADELTGAVYTSRDRGETWQVLESETQSLRERVLGLTLDGDVLYIGTEATGLWAAHLPSPR